MSQHQELLAVFCSMFVAILFLISGVAKLLSLQRFIAVVRDFDLLPDRVATLVGHLLPYFEILVATAVLLNVYRSVFLGTAIILLASFALAMSINLIRGRSDISCGCFGSQDNSQLTWFLVGRNLLLIGIAFIGSVSVTGEANQIGLLERFVVAVSIGSLIIAYYLQGLIVRLWQPRM